MKKFITSLCLTLSCILASAQALGDTITLTYKLHGQTRRFKTCFTPTSDGGVKMDWSIVRNLKLWQGSYTMRPQAVEKGNRLSFLMPEDGNNVTLPSDQTFAMLSRSSFGGLASGTPTRIDGVEWILTDIRPDHITCQSSEGSLMQVATTPGFPLIVSMQNSPLEINWTASWKTNKHPLSPEEEIAEIGERSGGIYYAYPFDDDVMPELPTGYTVTHISHYGRHGSRWVIRDFEYDILLDTMTRHNLTPFGDNVAHRVRALRAHAQGHAGELTALGQRQHRDIAERMYRRFPRLFADYARVWARSSVEPRCIMSMAAFSERLKELNPNLRIERHATPGDMRLIAYSSPQAKAINADTAAWWQHLNAYRHATVDPSRLMQSLFTDTISHDEGVYISWLLHNIAVDTQDTDPGIELLDIFTPDELVAHWRPLNYKMYYLHGNNPATDAAGPRSASSLLADIIDDIDSAIAGHASQATLRFGHDTALLRLLALMGVKGADAVEADPERYPQVWQDYRLAPMAANLQIILAQSTVHPDEPLILIRHNERPATISAIAPRPDGFYPWSAVKALWLQYLQQPE